MEARWRNPTALFFASIPDMKELCFVSLFISQEVLQRNEETSVHQVQVMKCRELIFTEQNVMATPALDNSTKIFITTTTSFWKSKALLPKLQKMGLKVGKASRLFPDVFKSCFLYTLTAKLAPSWNKVSDVFVQGRDFLISSKKLNAIKMDVTVTDEELTFALEASSIKLNANKIEDFEICTPVLEKFFRSGSGVINEYSIENKWCHVLPSMKKGKLVSITHDIPKSSPFKSYKDIRRHWKNTYGYRLPESEESVLFFNIYFPAIGHILFTYPEFCVRKRDVIVIPRTDPDPILESFLSDVHSKMPKICGMHFSMDRRPRYSKVTLCEASNEETDLAAVTLSDKPGIRKLPARRPIDKIHSSISNSQTKPTSHSTISYQASNLFRNASFLSANRPLSSQRDAVESTSAADIPSQQKIIPIFKAQCVRSPAKPQQAKTVPVFKQAKRPLLAHRIEPSQIRSTAGVLSSQPANGPRDDMTTGGGHRPIFSSQQPVPSRAFVSTTQYAMHGNDNINMEGEGSMAKKPKPKPKIQENVNVGLLAVNGQLSKVNAATLTKWLRERKIAVKAKDKKSDLIDKVMTHLQMKRMEEYLDHSGRKDGNM